MIGLPMAKELRLGLVGLDTSHVVAFAGILNDAEFEQIKAKILAEL